MTPHVRWLAGKNLLIMPILAALFLASGTALGVERLSFKPGFNLFSAQQDVQVGRDAAKQADQQLPLVTDAEVVRYVNDLGRRLATFAPDNKPDYAWTFKVVNSSDINAFALPGGFIYVNRGAIEAAENEAQIAGVIAHEEGHVVMRHGTHQASQAMLAQAPLAILGGVLGQSGSLTAQLAQMGIGFGVNSLMLRNSRSAESQADEIGTYILYNAGYDPRAMAQFFQIIEKKYPQQTIQFFSDHPNPENRIEKVEQGIRSLGPMRQAKTGSPEFEATKRRLLNMLPPPKAKPQTRGANNPPPPPSDHMGRFDGKGFALDYPDNWQVQRSEDAVALVPPDGIVTGPEGDANQAYGVSISFFHPQGTSQKNWGLLDATKQLLAVMSESNPNLRVVKQAGIKLYGRPALSTWLENDSPVQGQKEKDRLVTLRQNDALFSLIFIAPEEAYGAYQPTFDAMLQSLELP